MLEYLLRAAQKFSERYKFDLLFVKLKQELMILGTTDNPSHPLLAHSLTYSLT